jgi:hypothetical protein
VTEDDRQLSASGFRQYFSLADRKLFKPAGVVGLAASGLGAQVLATCIDALASRSKMPRISRSEALPIAPLATSSGVHIQL